jgi:hypothetical protein
MNALVFVVEETGRRLRMPSGTYILHRVQGICVHIRKKDTVAKNYHWMG